MERLNFCYFWEQANPETGMVKDRCQVQGNDYGIVGSIAATGFGLTAICIADERGLTLLFTEHDMAVVFRIAQKIAVLYQGRKLAEGPPAEVRVNPEVRRVYLGEHA